MASLYFRSKALWLLGYPEAAPADIDQALKDARESGHAASLFWALAGSFFFVDSYCGNYTTANARVDELIALADEKDAAFWKACGMLGRGWLLGLTGRAADAVQMITSGITAWRSTGATWYLPSWLSYLAAAHAELGQLDEAWRCIGEAMSDDRNNQRKMVRGRGQSHRGRNRAEVAGAGCGESGSVFRARARGRASAASKILGTARRNEHGAALARSGQAG